MKRTDLQRELIHELTGFTRKLRAQFDAAVAVKGLTLARARLLQAVSRNAGMAQSEIAAELEIETPTLVRLLDSMEQQDLIERRVSETDRRVKQISLTENGMKAAAETNEFIESFRDQLMKDLTDEELQSLLALMQRLSGGLQSLAEEGLADVQ